MPILELLTRSALYLASGYGLCLLSWVIAHRVLPRGTRPGWKLLTVILGQFMLTSVVVQLLGLAGMLRAGPYLFLTLSIGAAVSWCFRHRRPHLSLLNLCCRTMRLWIETTPWGLGYVGCGMLLLLTCHTALISGIDSLSIHGPMVVDWINQGKDLFQSHWYYPQCWEYQYVPNFLFLQSDVLVVVPRLLQALALMLLLRELGGMLGLPGRASQLTAGLCVFIPVIWGGASGAASLKNDVAFALGLLVCLTALLRLWNGRRGAIWPFMLGSFLVSGTKPTGFLYSGVMFLTVFLLAALRQRQAGRHVTGRLAALLALFIIVQATPLAVQAVNTVRNGNPVYPITVTLGGHTIFPGQLDLRGTAILDHAGDPETWLQLLRAGNRTIGIELSVLLVILVAALLHALGRLLVPGTERGAGPREGPLLLLGLATLALWFLFLKTPFSAGHASQSTRFISGGSTLRYAIAPLCLTYLIAASWLHHRLGRRYGLAALALTVPLLVTLHWSSALSATAATVSGKLFPAYLLIPLLLYGSARWARRTFLRRFAVSPRRRLALTAVAAVCTFVLLVPLYAELVEQRRLAEWSPHHRAIWRYVRDEMPKQSTIASNHRRPLWRFVLYGDRLNNRLTHAPLRPRKRPKALQRSRIRYYYLFFRPSEKKKATRTLAKFLESGWREVARNQNGCSILLVREGSGPPPPQQSRP